jgi:hypothetical protein
MAARKTAQTLAAGSAAAADGIEPRMVAFAEQLGRLIGTVEAKAEGWLDGKTLNAELARIRDGASELIDRVNRARVSVSQRKPVAAPAAAARPGRGAVDAPGKRHRKAPPQERLNPRMGEPVGKHLGQKTFKNSMRRGRGTHAG